MPYVRQTAWQEFLSREKTSPIAPASLASWLALPCLLAAIGCTGELGASGGLGNGDDGTGGPGGPGSGINGDGDGDIDKTLLPPGAAATDIRRLRQSEFRNTVRDLLPALPATFDPGEDIPHDNHVELAFAVPGTVSSLEVNRFADMAEEALELLGAGSPGTLAQCDADEATCSQQFIVDFATAAFRRPPLPQEIENLTSLYASLRNNAEATFPISEALDVVVEALLQSPGFLYRWELGPQAPQGTDGIVKYTPVELASRLSFFLWNTGPDEELLDAARTGGLDDAEGIANQARRMMTMPEFDRGIGDFVTQWLEITGLPTIVKDSGVYPNFNPGLAQAMYEEAQVFARDVFRGPDPTVTNLLTSTTSRVSPELASYYGVSPSADGSIDLTGTRKGILMQGAVQAAKGNSYRTSPVRRGKFVLNRLLCENVPPPPPDAVVDLPPADPNLTLREQLAMHASAPSCANCHSTMDPLGLAFEHFDGAGAYRDLEGTLEIDASGSITFKGNTWAFHDANELIDFLVDDLAVQDCFALQWTRYALGRFEQDAEEGSVARILAAHRDAALDLSELVVAIVTSMPFTHRALREGEATSL